MPRSLADGVELAGVIPALWFSCRAGWFIYSCVATKISDAPIMVNVSRAAARRFIRDFLAIGQTDYWFHQTLTFKDARTDEKTAKKLLYRLLDSLGKAFPDMPALFVQEWQKRQGLHYHVVFMVFGPQPRTPEEMRVMLEGEIFPRWYKLTGGTVVRAANQLKLRQGGLYALRYILKGIEPTDEKQKRQPHWHGIRKRGIITAHARSVTKQEVRTAWNFIFAGRKMVKPEPPAQVIDRLPDLAGMKAYLEETGAGADWEAFKRAVTGRRGKVSDNDLTAFYRGRGNPVHYESDPDTL